MKSQLFNGSKYVPHQLKQQPSLFSSLSEASDHPQKMQKRERTISQRDGQYNQQNQHPFHHVKTNFSAYRGTSTSFQRPICQICKMTRHTTINYYHHCSFAYNGYEPSAKLQAMFMPPQYCQQHDTPILVLPVMLLHIHLIWQCKMSK